MEILHVLATAHYSSCIWTTDSNVQTSGIAASRFFICVLRTISTAITWQKFIAEYVKIVKFTKAN